MAECDGDTDINGSETMREGGNTSAFQIDYGSGQQKQIDNGCEGKKDDAQPFSLKNIPCEQPGKYETQKPFSQAMIKARIIENTPSNFI